MRSESDKAAAPKARHIVSWTPEEDELLREQVSADGTDNWTSIAARFKDKTSRQCRRRWYTYLNSEGKKGGWSAEEDVILCEAQKIFGNRWTEIAKVVSGRTDNAVKNRFSTLCKKRTKIDALSEENCSWVNPKNKRVIIQNESLMSGATESSVSQKLIRYHILDHRENHNPNDRLPRQPIMVKLQLRPPLSLLDQNTDSIGGFPTQYNRDNNSKLAVSHGSDIKNGGSFLSRDDPKLTALLQQAEMLSSLALKINNSENTSQSLQNAWMELKDYLIQTGERGITSETFDMEFLLDDFKDLIEDLRSNSGGEQFSCWQPDLPEESQESSEYSTGSIQAIQVQSNDNCETDGAVSNLNAMVSCDKKDNLGPSIITNRVGALSSSEEPKEFTGNICSLPSSEYDSPHQTMPTFKSLTEAIPSPKFSTSERRFLRSVLGISSPAPTPSSAHPSCKRVLLDSL